LKKLAASTGMLSRHNNNVGLAMLACGTLVCELGPFLAGVILSVGPSREKTERIS